MRTAEIIRRTEETDVSVLLNLDGSGDCQIDSGVGFMDHMLTLFARHGSFDLKLRCKGDIEVDDHHSVEDMGIALGQAFAKALGEKRGIIRYGDAIIPMDEALVMTAADISGRGILGYAMDIPTEKVGSFDTDLVEEFWQGFVRNSGITFHIRQLAGTNSHHIIEACFKSAARSLRKAVAIDENDPDRIPSTKGVL